MNFPTLSILKLVTIRLAALIMLLAMLGAAQDTEVAQAARRAIDALVADRDAQEERADQAEQAEADLIVALVAKDTEIARLRAELASKDQPDEPTTQNAVLDITQPIILNSGEILENVTLKWTGRKPAPREPGKPVDWVAMVQVNSTDPDNPAIIRNVTFDTAYHQKPFGGIRAINFAGKGLVVEDVTFVADESGPALENALVAESTSSGLTMRDFAIEGTQAYGIWLGPVTGVLLEDGTVGPSEHEHGIRGGGWADVTLRRVKVADMDKSSLWLMDGRKALIEDCQFASDANFGPLDKGRHGDVEDRTFDVTIRNSTFAERLLIKHGCVNVTVFDGQYHGSIRIEADDSEEFAYLYDRPAKDIHFKGHTKVVIDSHAPGEGLVIDAGVGPWSVEHLDVRLEGDALTQWIPIGWNDYAFRVPSLEPIAKLTIPPSPLHKDVWPKGAIGMVAEQPVTIPQVKALKLEAVTVRQPEAPTP